MLDDSEDSGAKQYFLLGSFKVRFHVWRRGTPPAGFQSAVLAYFIKKSNRTSDK